MNRLLAIFLILMALTFFASPVQGEPYLTEEQKEALLDNSRALELDKKNALAQDVSEQTQQSEKTNIVKQQNGPVKFHQTGPIYLGWSSNNYPRTQSLQSIFNNANWRTPTEGNRPIEQSRQITSTAKSNRSIPQNQRLDTSIAFSSEPTPSHIKELISLVVLRDDGKITEEEYQQQKAEILAIGENAFDEELARPPQDEQVKILETVSGIPGQKEIETPSHIKELISLVVLRDDGNITEEEYQQQKAEILARK